MYAIIETGGKQYKVAPGDRVRVESLPNEVGSALELTPLAVVREPGEVLSGSAIANAKVVATVTRTGRAEKIIVFKFKRKKQYKRTIGHRQNFTELSINDIIL